MSEQPYATPQSNLNNSSSDLQAILEPLQKSKFWVRLCSIMGFISTAIMVLSGIGLSFMGNLGNELPVGGGVFGAMYILLGVLYFFPSYFLFSYASAIGTAQTTQSVQDVGIALEKQKSFWKFAGIMVLIMGVSMLLGIAAAIVIPAMSH